MAAPPLPLPNDAFLQELGHVDKSAHDYGDVEHAWYNLGLASATLASQAQFEDYARRLVQRIRPLWGSGGRREAREQARRRRLSIVLMALRTTLGYQRAFMDQTQPAADFPGPGDVAARFAFAARLAAIPRPPLAAPAVADLRARGRRRRDGRERAARRARYHARTQALYATPNEAALARARHYGAEAETARRFGGFAVRDGRGRVRTLLCTHAAYQDEGNSLWHVLAAQVRPRRANGGLNLRAGRVEKAMVYELMLLGLSRPLYQRHRLYCQMQAVSIEELRQRYGAGAQQLWADWGEMSLLRCLAVNEEDAGPPKYPQFKGVFQLISDMWRVEVLVWVGNAENLGHGRHYELHVFGPRSYGLYGRYPSDDRSWKLGMTWPDGEQEGGQGQLVFVTDPTWTHYSLPANVCFPFDTSHKSNTDRYGWLGLPFLNQDGPTNLNAWIPEPDQPPEGPYRTYAEHWAGRRDHEKTQSFEADLNVRQINPLQARMPIIPSAAIRAGWNQELDVNDHLLPYEPWNITTGCYRDPNRGPGDNEIKWGRFENKSAFEIHRLQAKLTAQGRTWGPRSTTMVQDEADLQ